MAFTDRYFYLKSLVVYMRYLTETLGWVFDVIIANWLSHYIDIKQSE